MIDLRERIADALESVANDPAAQLNGRLRRECLVQADAVLSALGMEQVGWWVEETHHHTTSDHRAVLGEFRFTEEEDGCPINGAPVYRVK